MYRKNFKSRKTPNSTNSFTTASLNSSDCNRLESVQSTSFSIQAQTNRNVPNIQTKRKSPFNDIDLSDLKFDTTLPSFLNASTSFNVTSELKPETKHLKTSNNNNNNNLMIVEANEWDFGDDDILDLEEPNKSEQKSNLSDNDKNEMIKLLVNDSIIKNKANDDFSDLLNDDFEIDDDDLFDIKTQATQNKLAHQSVAFKTALGTQLKPNNQCLMRAQQLFQSVETLFMKEVACFIWNMKHQFPIPIDDHMFSPISHTH